VSIHGGYGYDLSIGPTIAKMRRDNQLVDEVHDPGEDEPRIVGIPRAFQHPADEAPAGPEHPHS
jgi:hypothetical protein